MATDYGKFADFCARTGNRRSTLPVCNLFAGSQTRQDDGFSQGACDLEGISLGGGEYLANLGSIIIAGLAIITSLFLLWRSNIKRAAVGRREMQLFLLSYILVSICEIFTTGQFPLDSQVRLAFTAIHLAAIAASAWILMINGAVGYQQLDDGTPLSLGLLLLSAAAIFIATGYIALDTGFAFTDYWQEPIVLEVPNRSYSLYTLYQLAPLVFIVVYFVLETVLVLHVLGETRPMLYLAAAAVVFALGQVFQYVISPYICEGTGGAINGGLFSTLLTLVSVVILWVFWSSITEDDWPEPRVVGGSGFT